MSQYKLVYGDARGLAEPIRMVFALAKVPYEDFRVPVTPGQPPAIPLEIKSKLPYGQIPILEFDGQILSQSGAIARYLARKFNLHGSTDLESARIDELNDALKDYFDSWKAVKFAKGEEAKQGALKNAVEVATPKYLDIFTQVLQKNGEFLVGRSVSLADLTLAHYVRNIGIVFKVDLLKNHPIIQEHLRRIEAIPEIAEWIEKRPKTAT